jgi:spermidine synthase
LLPRINLGKVYLKQKKYKQAAYCFSQVLLLEKNSPQVYYYLGQSYYALGKIDLALSNYEKTLKLNPDNPQAHYRMALIMTRKSKPYTAVDHLNHALRQKPDYLEAHNEAAKLHLQLGNHSRAIGHLMEVIKQRPDIAEAHNNLAWLLATSSDDKIRNPSRAVEFAETASRLTDYKNPGTLDTLAAAYAAAGRFHQAIETAEKAIRLAEAQGNKELAAEIQKHLQLYRAGKPYREK